MWIWSDGLGHLNESRQHVKDEYGWGVSQNQTPSDSVISGHSAAALLEAMKIFRWGHSSPNKSCSLFSDVGIIPMADSKTDSDGPGGGEGPSNSPGRGIPSDWVLVESESVGSGGNNESTWNNMK